MAKTRKRGFTLVELLVVITIIAVLGTVSAIMGPRILKKGRQTKSITDLRQVTMYLTNYATDNNNRLPPPAQILDDETEVFWHTLLQADISSVPIPELQKDKWWRENDSILINSVFPKGRVNRSTTGYGLNSRLAANIAANRGEILAPEDALYTAVNTNAVRDPVRTPIIMPFWTWAYQCEPDTVSDSRWDDLMVGGKVPVLFLDGHVEVVSPREYISRRLNEVPES